MANDRCAAPASARRRVFWTTQPDACGTVESCGTECGRPGLKFTNDASCLPRGCSCCAPPHIAPDCLQYWRDQNPPQSFATNDWLRGLVINMLGTDGRRPDTPCGYPPGTQGGHWSESYRDDGQPIGTLMRTIGTSIRINDSMNLIKAQAQATLSRLIGLGVAKSVNVTARYLGNTRMALDIEVIGPAGDTARVGLSGARLEQEWVWS